MEHNETRHDESQPISERKEYDTHKHGKHIWGLVGATALLLAATAVVINFADIKRYIRITTM